MLKVPWSRTRRLRILRKHLILPSKAEFSTTTITRNYTAGNSSLGFISDEISAEDEKRYKFDYDLICVGGGSGGLATAKRAAVELEKRNEKFKIAVVDDRNPNHAHPKGTPWRWGLGGTCVNVGCVPKKLMHTAALIGDSIKHDAAAYGWSFNASSLQHSWETLIQHVQNLIRSSNFQYRVELKQNNVDYINALAKFVDRYTIETVNQKGAKNVITAKRFVVAVGGTPNLLDIPGATEPNCITSDDIFTLKKAPGKTLVIGASYIALECAGFLHGLGFETKIMMRSIPLRGFDRESATRVKDYMIFKGIPFITASVPVAIVKQENGRVLVKYQTMNVEGHVEQESSEEFDTVLFAVGRRSVSDKLGLQQLGIHMTKSGKIDVNEYEQTNVPNIYAIGDCIERGLELTPIAIHAGNLLAKRLFGEIPSNMTKEQFFIRNKMDYINVPTTVFTPLEYGCVGMSEEDAIKKYGEQNVEAYLINYKPLDMSLPALVNPEEAPKCLMKLVTTQPDEKVVGFHYVGPNAGEVTQGVAVAIKSGATKEVFDNTIGIHPTSAEEMTTLSITRRSGKDPNKKGC